MEQELYKVYRPKSFKEVVGQDTAIKMLTELGKRNAIPHTIMLSGPSGVGKTSIARILRHKLKCSDVDFTELNAADFRGIDMVRSIRQQVSLAPLHGDCRIWLIDEFQGVTGPASDAFLKILEDTPRHVYFFLATTDPNKIKKTIKTRCTEIKLALVNAKDMTKLLYDVYEKNGGHSDLSKETTTKIVDIAEGSPRKALVLLHSIVGIGGKKDQLEILDKGDINTQGIDLARALMERTPNWKKVAGILKKLEDDVETVRYIVLGYARTVLLSSGNKKAYVVIDCFSSNFYDSKAAGLAAACYEVLHE